MKINKGGKRRLVGKAKGFHGAMGSGRPHSRKWHRGGRDRHRSPREPAANGNRRARGANVSVRPRRDHPGEKKAGSYLSCGSTGAPSGTGAAAMVLGRGGSGGGGAAAGIPGTCSAGRGRREGRERGWGLGGLGARGWGDMGYTGCCGDG